MVEPAYRHPPALPKGLKVVIGPSQLVRAGYRQPQKSAEVVDLLITRRWLSWFPVILFLLILVGNIRFFDWHHLERPLWMDVGVSLCIAYWAVAGLVNKTTLCIAQGRLSVRHGPLPWLGNRQLALTSIQQIYTERKVQKSRKGDLESWSVHASTDDGPVKLLSGLRNNNEARYIEWCIETHLGIVDEPSMNAY